MSTLELTAVDELLQAEPVYTATCSLCRRRGPFLDPRQRQEAFEATSAVQHTTSVRCADCERNLEKALLKAWARAHELSPEQEPTKREQRDGFEAMLEIGGWLENAVRLDRPDQRAGPKPNIRRWFAVGVFFHIGWSDEDILWMLGAVTGEERNPRYITRLRETSGLPIVQALRAKP